MFNDILNIDSKCTNLLIKGVIANENSFTGNFVVKIYEKNNASIIARNLKPGQEQKLGCDGMVVLEKDSKSCIIGFWEAKLPKKGGWDKREKNNLNLSHFNKQMNLQQQANICSWEMFYNNNDNLKKNKFQTRFSNNSLCVWRKDIYNYTTNTWSNTKLSDFVTKNPLKCKKIDDILKDLLANKKCLYHFNNGLVKVAGFDVFIPFKEYSESSDKEENVTSLNYFMRKMGLRYAIIINSKDFYQKQELPII